MGEQPTGQKYILNLYAAFGVSLILAVLPFMAAAFLSLVFFMGVLIGAYALRKRAGDCSLSENHATFIIRTLWISAFLSLVTTVAATAYMMSGIDYSTFEPCANSLAHKGPTWVESAGTMEIYAVIEPCIESFISFNKALLTNALLIAGGPVILYMAYRMVKGLSRAVKGYRLSDPKGWF
ncbi:MAG: hypothetical protein R3E13_09380 [Alphaproteobacteria bacterium]